MLEALAPDGLVAAKHYGEIAASAPHAVQSLSHISASDLVRSRLRFAASRTLMRFARTRGSRASSDPFRRRPGL